MISSVLNWIKICKNWPLRILEFLGYSKKILAYNMRNGLTIYLNGNNTDSVVMSDLYINDPYLMKNIKDNSTVVDIGAHLGIFSTLAAIRAKNVKVYSFEPFPKNFNLLKRNVAKNNLTNVKIFPFAVHDKRSSATMFQGAGGASTPSIFEEVPTGKTGETEKVNTITLSDVFSKLDSKEIDFLKMDCEGSEYPVLMKNKKLLKRIKYLGLEYHAVKDYTVEQLIDYLKANNFEIKRTNSGGQTFVAKNKFYYKK